jgi:hypothetical protein
MSPLREMYAAADDVSEWAVKHQQARFQPIGSAIPDPRPAPRYVPQSILCRADVRQAINDHDQANAIEWMFTHGELSEELCERIEEKSLDFCKLRLEAEGRDAQ